MLAYIKPHALAAMAGFAVFFLVHSLKRWREREWPRRLLLLTFLAGIAIGIFCINATILGRLTFAPQFVGNIYAGPLQVAFSWSHFLQAAQTLIGFACLHTLILIMLFLLAFAGALQAVILINADLYRWGARHELDYASRAFIEDKREWPDDAIKQNQLRPANSFSDHYTVCEFAHKVALPVQAFADLIAYHQRA